MNKLVLILWSIFFLSCGSTRETLKSNTANKIQKPSIEKMTSQTNEIQKIDTIQVDNKIVENFSPEKTITLSPTLTTEEHKTKIEATINKTSTKTSSKLKKDTPISPKEKTDVWNELLMKYVNNDGDVDYKGLLKDKKKLEAYLNNMAINSPQTEWSKKEKLVYYINIYNAGTVKLILDNYPTESIKNINKPWDREIIKIGESTFSLGDIEHKILRKMNEPRIHFAINCASYSCPKLINKAFTVSNIEKMLEMATINFVNDSKRNKITADKLQLSNIFKWYKKDFTDKGSLIDYINPYIKIDIAEKASISFLKYDWGLNETK